MRFKGIKIGKSKEEPKEETIETNETTVTQIAEMEDQMNNKTKDLEETSQQLQELSETVNGSEETEAATEDDTPKPHGPLSELEVEPGDDLAYDDINVDTQPEDAGEDVQLVEVGAESDAPTETPQEPKLEDADDSLKNLFSDDEEEVNPLANLINSLPDVTAQELVDDLNEIQEIIKEWQKS